MKRLIYLLVLLPSLLSGQVLYKGKPVYYQGKPLVSDKNRTPLPLPSCNDGILNGDETGIDCGGSCAACPGEPTATISVSPLSANESVGSVTFSIAFDIANIGAATVVNYIVSGGATSGTDYTALSGTVTIADGQTTSNITVNITNDVVAESEETIVITLTSGVGYALGSPVSATFTIIDDDDAIAVCTPDPSPTSVTTLSGLTGATPGETLQINGNINASGATFAANLIIVSGTGTISGSNINLNNACVYNDYGQIFESSVTFISRYDNSRLSPETFGADGSDGIADDAALVSLITNSQYAIGQTGAVYIKNEESVLFPVDGSGTGIFDWDMNESTVRTTSAAALSHDNTDLSSKKYLFEIRDIGVKITNGEFDGQDLASRCFFLRDVASYDFQNVNVHNYYAPPGAKIRGMGFLIEVDDTFTGGQIINSVIDSIGAASDAITNNTPYGYSKGILIEVATENNVQHLIQGNTISNIYGDDAEGFHATHRYLYDYNHNTNLMDFVIDNNNFINCARRAIKVFLSHTQITNNIIESVTNAEDYNNNHASMVQVFSVKSGQAIRDVNVTGNTIRIRGDSNNNPFGINDATDCLIENNVFESNYVAYDRGISFAVGDSQGGLYSGDLSNTVIFRNNTITNLYIRLLQLYDPINGGFVFESNTINLNIDRYVNGWYGTFLLVDLSGDSQPYTISNTTINVNMTYNAGNLFSGVFVSLGANMKNLTLNNVDINYTGSFRPTYPFARIGTPGYTPSFDSTNSITNCDLTGDVGTNAIYVYGTPKNPVITNSFGDGATILTVE